MKPYIQASRAVGARYVYTFIRGFLPAAIGILIVLVAGCVWLLTQSWWWLLLALPIFILSLLIISLYLLVMWVIRRVNPPMNQGQVATTERIVEKLQTVSDMTSTPKFFIFVRILASLLRSPPGVYLQSILEVRSVQRDIQDLIRSFEGKSMPIADEQSDS